MIRLLVRNTRDAFARTPELLDSSHRKSMNILLTCMRQIAFAWWCGARRKSDITREGEIYSGGIVSTSAAQINGTNFFVVIEKVVVSL
jgi:hypothetical protein